MEKIIKKNNKIKNTFEHDFPGRLNPSLYTNVIVLFFANTYNIFNFRKDNKTDGKVNRRYSSRIS